MALLILLYAQPLIKIARLTVADVELDAGEVRLRFGVGEAVPIIAPFSDVLLDHIATRSNQTTATNSASTLLFPGRRAGQPVHPGSLRLRLHRLGIPNLNGRTRAIATYSSKRHLRSSPACSATTPPAPNCSPPRPAQPGNATRQAITHSAVRRLRRYRQVGSMIRTGIAT